MENLTAKEGKSAAIIAYLTIVGTVIAIFMNQDTKNEFARFHIRQAFGIHILFWLLGYFVGLFDSWLISMSFWVFVFILWIYGFLGAIQEKRNMVPVLGEKFQQWFSFIR